MVLQNEADAYRKMRLRVEEVQGRNCLTNFHVSLVTYIFLELYSNRQDIKKSELKSGQETSIKPI